MTQLLTIKDLNEASNALRDWFQSQDFCPADCVMTFEFFMAKMMLTNGKSPEDIEQKFELMEQTIRAFMAKIQQVTL